MSALYDFGCFLCHRHSLFRLSMTIASILFTLGIFAALLPTGARAEASDKPLALPTQVRHIPLSRLEGKSVIALRTTEGSATINFGTRRDELVTKAWLK